MPLQFRSLFQADRETELHSVRDRKKKEVCFDLDFPKRKQSLFSRGQIMSLIHVALP